MRHEKSHYLICYDYITWNLAQRHPAVSMPHSESAPRPGYGPAQLRIHEIEVNSPNRADPRFSLPFSEGPTCPTPVVDAPLPTCASPLFPPAMYATHTVR